MLLETHSKAMKIAELKVSLKQMEDPRRTTKGNFLHKLEDIIIGLCSLICNGSDFVDMEEFGEARQEWLKQFLELPNGIPDSDTFRRVFECLNPTALAECLYDWKSPRCQSCWIIWQRICPGCLSERSGQD